VEDEVDGWLAVVSVLEALPFFSSEASDAAVLEEVRVGVAGMLFEREPSSVSLLSISTDADSLFRKSSSLEETTGLAGVEG
jgi:hypothetical protein